MKILLDESLDVKLKDHLPEFETLVTASRLVHPFREDLPHDREGRCRASCL